MAGRTISGAYLTGVTLSDPANTNPVNVALGATISSTTGAAVQATGTIDWTLDNFGQISSTAAGTLGVGIALGPAGGTITNEFAATIQGTAYGIQGSAPATVISAGTIAATATATGSGILLPGGAVVNGAGALITGGLNGISLTGAGAVINSGTAFATKGAGAVLTTGVFSNTTSALVSGYVFGLTAASAATVTNQGTIVSRQTTGTGFVNNGGGYVPSSAGVVIGSGLITNAAGGTISSPLIGAAIIGAGASIDNAGLIKGIQTTISGATTNTIGFGAWLIGGGTVNNAASGTIIGGHYGLVATGSGATTVINAGSIAGSQLSGVDLFGSATGSKTGTITSAYIAVLARVGGQIINSGSISATYGIDIAGAGSVTNTASGHIATSGVAIISLAPGATIVNDGTASSTHTFGGAGIELRQGGVFNNGTAGVVNAAWIGVQFGQAAQGTTAGISGNGTLTNAGTIFASDGTNGAAAWMHGTGVILNQSTGTITGGPYGVVAYYDLTIINAGSIGGTQYSIFPANAGHTMRLDVTPGAKFSGLVLGDKSGAVSPKGILDLGAQTGTGAAVGTISGFGSKYLGFASVIVDAGANWSLGGTVTSGQTISMGGPGATLTLANPGAVAGTITGFSAGTTLALGGITDVTSATLGPNNVLSVVEAGGGTITLRFDPIQNFSGITSFTHFIDGTGTDLVLPCFVEGTRIATAAGPVAVEHLAPGMRVASVFGGTAEIVWIGHRRVDCARHPRPQDIWPVRIAPDAFGPGLPAAPLWLSPDHAVHVADVLVPIRYLVNGRTIVQEPRTSVTYYHIELPAHDVIRAEGLPCESFLDTGNRGAFTNSGGPIDLHPDFARAVWDAEACAPLVLGGARLSAIRAMLLAQAARLGFRRISAPALDILADGRPLAAKISGAIWQCDLPPGTAMIELRSRAHIPAETDPASADTRRLGVAIADLRLDGQPVPLTDPAFAQGWQGAEPDWRWTDGAGHIIVAGAARVAFELALTGLYWDEAPVLRAEYLFR
ncbi:MAG: Hint domain-containing protein [Alphaproteobacteria bacterium]|nr:Hint domain-containing protein [Alphaproteobacteria bacterium]